MRRFDDGNWYAATVESVHIDQNSHERVYKVQFDHGQVEEHGQLQLKKLLNDSKLKELTMEQYLGTVDSDSIEDDILGGDMIAYMAAHTQKEDAIQRPGASNKRKPPSSDSDNSVTVTLACFNKTCETHSQKRFRLYKKGNSRSKERYCKRHADQRTSDNYVPAEFVSR